MTAGNKHKEDVVTKRVATFYDVSPSDEMPRMSFTDLRNAGRYKAMLPFMRWLCINVARFDIDEFIDPKPWDKWRVVATGVDSLDMHTNLLREAIAKRISMEYGILDLDIARIFDEETDRLIEETGP